MKYFFSDKLRVLALFMAASFILVVFLFTTVHKRTVSKTVLSQTDLRFFKAVQDWITEGYFKHGGMKFFTYDEAVGLGYVLPPKESFHPGTVFAWQNSTLGWLQLTHLTQRIYYLLHGRFSYRLNYITNQLIPAASSALLGFLAFTMALRMGLGSLKSLFLGLACLLIHQTFPLNLFNYFAFQPVASVIPFMLTFLVIDELQHSSSAPESTLWHVARILIALLLFFMEPVSAALFMGSYLLVKTLLAEKMVPLATWAWFLLFPFITTLIFMQAQKFVVKLYFHDIYFSGSNLLFRTGLDGDKTYYSSHWDLITRSFATSRRDAWQFSPFVRWTTLFVLGSVSGLFVVSRYLREQSMQKNIRILLTLTGLYVFFAAIFSQAVVIHPYSYDLFLVIPCILSAVCLLPSYLEMKTGHKGIFVLATVVFAVVYSMCQLRTYVLAYPL